MNHHALPRLAATLVVAGGLLTACGKPDAPAAGQPAAEASPAAAAPATAPEIQAAPPGGGTITGSPADSDGIGPVDGAVATPSPADAVSAPASTSAATAATAVTTAANSAPPPPATASTLAATTAAPAATRPATPATPASTAAGEPGTLVRAESLRGKPASDASELAALAGGSPVSVLGREGAWYKVSAGGKTGWVRMLSVRRSAGASGGNIGGIAGIASGRTGTGSVVTTTGVRGLDSEDLQTASFNEARVAKAESMRVDRAAADAFAQAGGLKKQSAPDLPAAK